MKTLTELRQWNIAHQRAGAIKYGQANLDISDEMDLQADRERYEADRRKDILLSATNGLDAALKANRLDALLFPGVSQRGIAARPGYPTVTVPYGFVPVPRGHGRDGVSVGLRSEAAPFNVSFTGDGVQRAEADRARVRVRAGDEEAHRTALFPLTTVTIQTNGARAASSRVSSSSSTSRTLSGGSSTPS